MSFKFLFGHMLALVLTAALGCASQTDPNSQDDRTPASSELARSGGSGDYRSYIVQVAARKSTKRKSPKGKSVSSAPIYGSFIAQMNKCKKGCKPVSMGTWGSRGNKSCHPQGKAVDLFGLDCGGKKIMAPGAEYSKFVACMRQAGWKALYKEGKQPKKGTRSYTTQHWDHAHFSLGCQVNGKRVW